MAKRVKRIVLRVLTTGVQLDGQKEHCGDHWLILKFDAATLKQRQRSHVWDWCGVSLSSGLGVVRTTVLDILGSNKPMYMVHPL